MIKQLYMLKTEEGEANFGGEGWLRYGGPPMGPDVQIGLKE
ncbi:hypothetical protein ACHADS_16590 [Bacillus vallismortis]